MRDAHRLILGEIHLQPVRDLLRTPGRHPLPVLTVGLVADFPRFCLEPLHQGSVREVDVSRQPFLHILVQPLMSDELRLLRTKRQQIRFPLRDRDTVVQPARAGRRISTKLAGDRRRSTAQPAPYLADSGSLRPEQGYLFTLVKRQIATRKRGKID